MVTGTMTVHFTLELYRGGYMLVLAGWEAPLSAYTHSLRADTIHTDKEDITPAQLII